MSETNCRLCAGTHDCDAVEERGLHCTRERGHIGVHAACRTKPGEHPIMTWSYAPAPAPAPIDPVLVTLAAAFIAARLPHEPSEDAIRHGISDALATRAALREAGEGTK